MSQFLNGDVALYYESTGEGAPIFLSHGFGATSVMWRPQARALAPDYRTVAWDMRGHGRSASPEDPAAYSLDATIEDLAALLDHCGAKRAVIGGHSLGGYVSLAFADRYPDRVTALLLVGTGPGFKRDEPRARWNANADRQADKLEERGLDGLPSDQSAWAGSHESAAGLARAARGMLAQEDARVFESLGRVSVPTLVLVGSNDHAFLQAAEVMAGKIAGATSVMIEDAGHAANVDQPNAVNTAIREFLTRHRSETAMA